MMYYIESTYFPVPSKPSGQLGVTVKISGNGAENAAANRRRQIKLSDCLGFTKYKT